MWILQRELCYPGGLFSQVEIRETYFSQMGEMKLRKLRTCSSLSLELWDPGVKAKMGHFVKAHLR